LFSKDDDDDIEKADERPWGKEGEEAGLEAFRSEET
jgi:hypothetical protein